MTQHNEELELFRDTVRRFLADNVEPHYEKWEREGIFPKELYLQMGEAGLLCVDLPEEYGGMGATFQFSSVVVEEASRFGFLALASNLSVHSDIAAPYILHLGTEAQRQKYLPRMARGECIGAIGMTEPGAGSDLQGMKTSAIADGDDYLINGSKTFITNGQNAGVVVLATKTDPKAGAKGITLFTVDTSLPGFQRGRNLEKIGLHAADTSELFFDNLRVSKDEVLGKLGGGFGHLIDELPRERLILSTSAVYHALGALEKTIEYVTTRKAFGTPIASFQNTRFELAKVKTDIEVHRAFAEKCTALYDSKALDVPTAAMLKLATTEMEGRVTDACLQLFGGYGYMVEYPISRFYCDARIQRIYGGTSEIMKEVIARSLVGR
ncbi:acyl-CoA dehydrogenase family protein [Sinimarinibacterium sp. NLF-5-8]|uniref:acyl-CoA dehydrogenase family protein n=1 Tax=Sinimarinibacterium sp. NLF-5-8 TaxID=2698684 RepID=UPI00137C1010|nr:acyl-CoA dehydrogenase family protein [Sinimarinibacterium sp. NLF-5-8]QHS11314.1 acyl-CoA dehydrogenase [Sinimarinibacterium sp. NLF-5-8]